jgi:hypothetical protein
VLSKIPRNYDRERLETLWVTLGASSLRHAMTKRAVVGARVGLRGKHGHLRRWRSFPFAGFWHRRVHIQRVTLERDLARAELARRSAVDPQDTTQDGAASVVVIDAGFV